LSKLLFGCDILTGDSNKISSKRLSDILNFLVEFLGLSGAALRKRISQNNCRSEICVSFVFAAIRCNLILENNKHLVRTYRSIVRWIKINNQGFLDGRSLDSLSILISQGEIGSSLSDSEVESSADFGGGDRAGEGSSRSNKKGSKGGSEFHLFYFVLENCESNCDLEHYYFLADKSILFEWKNN